MADAQRDEGERDSKHGDQVQEEEEEERRNLHDQQDLIEQTFEEVLVVDEECDFDDGEDNVEEEEEEPEVELRRGTAVAGEHWPEWLLVVEFCVCFWTLLGGGGLFVYL